MYSNARSTVQVIKITYFLWKIWQVSVDVVQVHYIFCKCNGGNIIVSSYAVKLMQILYSMGGEPN